MFFSGTVRALPYASKVAMLCMVALITGYLSLWLSFQYEFHDKLVSWYFPHGLRVVALFLLPFKFWCLFLFFSIVGSDAYYHINVPNDEGISDATLYTFMYYYSMEVAGGFLTYLGYKRFVSNWFSVHGVLWLIILSMFYRFIYLIGPALFKLGFFSIMPADRYVEFFVAIQLSGYLVGFYVLYIAMFVKWFIARKHMLSKQQYQTLGLSLFSIILIIFSLHYWHPSLEYLLRIAVFIPLIIVAAKYGWFGVTATAFAIVSALFVYLYGQPGEVLIGYQPFILSYLLIGLLVSAVMYEKNETQLHILAANDEVIQKNQNLVSMNHRMTELSRKIIDIQEIERKYLSQELHDEVGQNITALKSAIYLNEISTERSNNFESIKENADMIYHSVYELMHWLRPSILDEFGLYKTLYGEYFREKLAMADIEYTVHIDTAERLDKHTETALFRICQEAVNNALKHSDATSFDITLYDEDNCIVLEISDNGSNEAEPTSEPTSGFGLEGISDRVMTLNGTCIFSRQDGFSITINIPI